MSIRFQSLEFCRNFKSNWKSVIGIDKQVDILWDNRFLNSMGWIWELKNRLWYDQSRWWHYKIRKHTIWTIESTNYKIWMIKMTKCKKGVIFIVRNKLKNSLRIWKRAPRLPRFIQKIKIKEIFFRSFFLVSLRSGVIQLL